MITTPCENASKYALPAIRANIAKMLASKKYTQKKIANILGVTQPAVSKYLSDKYDSKLKFVVNDKKVKMYAEEIYNMIIQGVSEEDVRFSILSRTARLLKENPNLFD
ncbi:MAG: ArsR family transcriptional regulator [Candidatus Aenigmarchaeota archaeon]|nr:ArsR family transcriptional regulator [Candidatus Aenigmarchaeota archaeon]MBU5688768.1 ArsR family transcriptional regulator [Candidatus Aenigmarchaeota archaeon]